MNLSHAYPRRPRGKLPRPSLRTRSTCGVTQFDTAALYGFGANEELLGPVLKPHRAEIVLASKCGMFRNDDGPCGRSTASRTLRRTCDDSLRRLQTDVIDLYYLHRKDPNVPIEDSIGALADLVRQGKVRAIGVSEVSAATLRQAHAVHPIAGDPERVLALDAQPGDRGAGRLPRARHRVRRLQPARARVSLRRAA